MRYVQHSWDVEKRTSAKTISAAEIHEVQSWSKPLHMRLHNLKGSGIEGAGFFFVGAWFFLVGDGFNLSVWYGFKMSVTRVLNCRWFEIQNVGVWF